LDTFTETSTAPHQAVAAVNLGEQGPSSVSESVSHPDVISIQHIVGDAVSSGRENVIQEERSRTHPLTATEGREGLNAGIPESKALFVVSKGEWLRRLLAAIGGPCTDKLFIWWVMFHVLLLVSWLLISLAPWIKDFLLPFC